jgi:hypothetical protein
LNALAIRMESRAAPIRDDEHRIGTRFNGSTA